MQRQTMNNTSCSDEVLPLSNIQRSWSCEFNQAFVNEQPEFRRARVQSENDFAEFVLGLAVFLIGTYLPNFCFRYLLEAIVHKSPPFQLTSAGDVILDMQINEALVDPATVSCALFLCFCVAMSH